jgi:hypothetical protein
MSCREIIILDEDHSIRRNAYNLVLLSFSEDLLIGVQGYLLFFSITYSYSSYMHFIPVFGKTCEYMFVVIIR